MSSRPLIIAHRGASWAAPENTLAAAELAWQEGADAVEADFRLTADGRLVAIHDESTLRVSGVNLPVAETTLGQLRRLDVGAWKDQRWVGQRLATLDEMLATTPPDRQFVIEIKCTVKAAGRGHGKPHWAGAGRRMRNTNSFRLRTKPSAIRWAR